MSIQTSGDVAVRLRALADPVRLRLLREIGNRPGGESCVCDLLDVADVSQPTLSHHLKILRTAGLVNSDRRGTWVYYRLIPEAVTEVAELLADIATVSGVAEECR